MENIKIIVTNSKARFNYFLSDFLECGIELQGTEIKSLRKNGATLGDSYVIIRNGEILGSANNDITECRSVKMTTLTFHIDGASLLNHTIVVVNITDPNTTYIV